MFLASLISALTCFGIYRHLKNRASEESQRKPDCSFNFDSDSFDAEQGITIKVRRKPDPSSSSDSDSFDADQGITIKVRRNSDPSSSSDSDSFDADQGITIKVRRNSDRSSSERQKDVENLLGISKTAYDIGCLVFLLVTSLVIFIVFRPWD